MNIIFIHIWDDTKWGESIDGEMEYLTPLWMCLHRERKRLCLSTREKESTNWRLETTRVEGYNNIHKCSDVSVGSKSFLVIMVAAGCIKSRCLV